MRKSTTNELILLDTHVTVWLAEDSPQLKAHAKDRLRTAFSQQRLYLSPISAWEIGLLVAQKKLSLPLAPLIWFNDFAERFRVTLFDITPEIAMESSFLPGDFHKDPADRLLIATARRHSAVIATTDKAILSYGQKGFVQTLPCR